jgi:hypothetical protein
LFINVIFGRYKERFSIVLVYFETIDSKPLSLNGKARQKGAISPLLVGHRQRWDKRLVFVIINSKKMIGDTH